MKRVCAIICAYNEEDIVEECLLSLIRNGVSVHFIDNGSTDRTAAIAGAFVGRGVTDVQSVVYRDTDGVPRYDWISILKLKESLSKRLGYDWYIHADADEIRSSPWAGVSLSEAVDRVDFEGYSLINFKVFNFRPTTPDFVCDGFEAAFTYYENAFSGDATQVKAWRGSSPVDLHSTGGHRATIENGKVYPIRFVLKHYPLRNAEQILRKLTTDRSARFSVEELRKGWHRQYTEIPARVLETGCWAEALLTKYDEERELDTLLKESAIHSAMAWPSDGTSAELMHKNLSLRLGERGYSPESVSEFLSGVFRLANRIYNDDTVAITVDHNTARVLRYCLSYLAAQYFLAGDNRLAGNLHRLIINTDASVS